MKLLITIGATAVVLFAVHRWSRKYADDISPRRVVIRNNVTKNNVVKFRFDAYGRGIPTVVGGLPNNEKR